MAYMKIMAKMAANSGSVWRFSYININGVCKYQYQG